MIIRFLIVACLFFDSFADAALVHRIPECPRSADSTCSDGLDNDADGTIDEAAPSLAFAAVTGGYAAEAEDGVLAGNATSVVDATASGGDYVSLTSGSRFGSGQVALCGNFTNGTYYVWPRVITPTPASSPLSTRAVWVDTSPLTLNLDNTKSAALSTLDDTDYNFASLPANLNFVTGQHGTAQASFTLNGNACLYFALQDGIKLDAVFVSTTSSATPVLPGVYPDVTPPTLGTPVTPPPTLGQTNAIVRATVNEVSQCWAIYGTVSGSLTSTGAETPSSAGNCDASISGLTASTLCYYRIKARDPEMNVGQSAEASFTTTGSPPGSPTVWFSTANTWTTPIGASPVVRANSANYIADILLNSSFIGFPSDLWAPTVWEAAPSDPVITVTLTLGPGDTSLWETIVANATAAGYNQVRMPAAAVSTGSNDSWVTIYDATYVWEMYKAVKTDATHWSAKMVRRWTRTGTGTIPTYDLYGSAWRCATSARLQGTITKDEIDKGQINHALVFGYYGEVKGTHWGEYPCRQSVAGVSTRTWAMNGGYRIQLDPAFNVDALSVTEATKVVLRTLQTYGMIFSYNNGIGSNAVVRESATGKAWNWAGVFSTIPTSVINNLRVIDQICAPGETGCP